MNFKILLLTTILTATSAMAAEQTIMDKSKLTPMQQHIISGGTEKPFDNEYWDNHEDGIYVDLVSGKPLFSSLDKFDSGTGWPSFTKPIEDVAISTKTDTSFGMSRVEVKSSDSESHLGHVFNDGPKDKGGSRYCINSGAMRFIPKESLEKEGYGKYLNLFDKK